MISRRPLANAMRTMTLLAALAPAQAAWAQSPPAGAHAAQAAGAPAAPAALPPSAPNDDIQAAIVKRDAARVAALLRAGRKPDFNFNDAHPGRSHESPLTMCMNRNFTDIARVLLEGGADPNRRDGSGRAPIHQARSAEAARLLVQAGADPNALDASGRSALAIAVERGDLQAVDALLAAGARLDAPLKGAALLARAIEWKQPQLVRPLLERGVDARTVGGSTLAQLIDSGDDETLKLLLQRGADPNARGSHGEPLLVRALFRQRHGLAEALIDSGANVRLADDPKCVSGAPFGCLSIQLARLGSLHPPLLSRMVAKGLDLNAVAASRHTALSSLVAEPAFAVQVAGGNARIPAPDNVARVKALLEAGADPNIKYASFTPLMLAVSDPRKPAGFADVLIAHGGTIEFEYVISKADSERFAVATPGMPAAADTNLVYNNQGVLTGMGIGPLSWAVVRGRPDVALRLLDKGHKVGRADRHLLYFAAAFGHFDAISGLLRHTREVDAADRADVTPLMFAAGAGHAGAVRALLAAGASVNTRSAREWPPLHERNAYHYIGGHAPSRPPLVGGYTALGAARERGHQEVVRILAEAGGRD